MMQVECRELGGRDGGSRKLFTSSQFPRRMGAGGAKPLLTKVISPLCSFFKSWQISSHVDSHIQQPPHKDDLPLSISIKVF